MNWVRADQPLADHRAVLFISQKQMMIERMVLSILSKAAEDSERLESAVLELIRKYRPELAGCVVFYMGFNANHGCWEFAVSHGSLPRVKMFDQASRMPLDPAYERAMADHAGVA